MTCGDTTLSPVESVLRLVPWWVPWANVLVVVPYCTLVAAISSWACAAAAGRPFRKALRAGDAPHHELARLAWPLRRSLWRWKLTVLLLVPLVAALSSGPFDHVSGGWMWAIVVVAVFFSMRFVTRGYRWRSPRVPMTWRQWWKTVAFVVLVFARLPVLVALPFFVGPELDQSAAVAVAVGGVLFVLLSGPLWLWACHVAQVFVAPSPRLVAAVASAAAHAGIAVPKTYEADLPFPNAFALPSRRLVFATTPLLKLLDDDELASVCAHELGHVRESKSALFVRRFALVGLLPIVFCRPIAARFQHEWIGDAAATAICIVSALVAALAVKVVGGRLEDRADTFAHSHQGDTGAYARALEKLHRETRLPLTFSRDPTRKRGLLRRLFSHDTHGSFAERIVAAGGKLPEGLRPPSRWRTVAGVAAGIAVLAPGLALLVCIQLGLEVPVVSRATALELSLGIGREWEPLVELGDVVRTEGRLDEAITLERAAVELSHGWPGSVHSLAMALIDAGRLDEAESVIRDAERDLGPNDEEHWYTAPIRDARRELDRRRAASNDAPRGDDDVMRASTSR